MQHHPRRIGSAQVGVATVSLADIPGVPVAIKYAAQNHNRNRNDSRVLRITVPAVTDT